jgi:hypothetical protein
MNVHLPNLLYCTVLSALLKFDTFIEEAFPFWRHLTGLRCTYVSLQSLGAKGGGGGGCCLGFCTVNTRMVCAFIANNRKLVWRIFISLQLYKYLPLQSS